MRINDFENGNKGINMMVTIGWRYDFNGVSDSIDAVFSAFKRSLKNDLSANPDFGFCDNEQDSPHSMHLWFENAVDAEGIFKICKEFENSLEEYGKRVIGRVTCSACE